jgi:hypothetical protein
MEDTVDAVETSAADWLQIIRAEFLEVPGLQLTRAQAQRLWGLEPQMCDALLDVLVDIRFLRATPNGRFARVDADY